MPGGSLLFVSLIGSRSQSSCMC